jgi:hypothetical protein
LLGRSAFAQIEQAERLSGVADALCISGGNFAQLEKAVALFVPKNSSIANSKQISTDDLKEFVELLKKIR